MYETFPKQAPVVHLSLYQNRFVHVNKIYERHVYFLRLELIQIYSIITLLQLW